MMRTANCNKKSFEDAYAYAKALQVLMYQVDVTYNRNPYQPGIKTCTKVLLPTFYSLFEETTKQYNHKYHANLDPQAIYMPFTLSSNVTQLASLPIQRKGKMGNISPSNEVIRWQSDGEVVINMDQTRILKSLSIDLGIANIAEHFNLEVTADGQLWEKLSLQPTNVKTRFKAEVTDKKVQKIRLTNTSEQEQQVYFKQFGWEEK